MKTIRTRLFATLLTCVASSLFAQDQTALSVEDVVMLLELSGPPPAVLAEVRYEMIRERCVAFPVNAATTARLRSQGADQGLLNVIHSACYVGSEIVIESQPGGAEAWVDSAYVGLTPLSMRALPRDGVKLTVRSNARVLVYQAALQPQHRTRAFFVFHEDTLPVPHARSALEVIRDAGLAAQWRPSTPEPLVPKLEYYESKLSVPIYLLSGAAGTAFCASSSKPCGDNDFIYAIGSIGGFFVGYVLMDVVWNPLVNSKRKKSHQKASQVHASWSQANEAAKAAWLQNHPAVRTGVSNDAAARRNVIEENSRIRARNQSLPSSFLRNERVSSSAGW